MGSRAEIPARFGGISRDRILAALSRSRGSRAVGAWVDPPGAGEAELALKNPVLAPYTDEIRRAADLCVAQRPPALTFSLYRRFEDSGDRAGFEGAYFARRRALVFTALAVWLWGRSDHLAALEDLIWSICDEYAWSLPAHLGGTGLDPAGLSPLAGRSPRASDEAKPPNHSEFLDLFACETAFALSEIRALLLDSLTPIVAERARREVERRVLRPFLRRTEPWPWELMDTNWCAVCAGSIGSAALYAAMDSEELASLLTRLLPTLGRFLDGVGADGACLEGLGYWTYGVGFFVSFAELLGRATSGDIDLLGDPGLAALAAFQSRAYLTDSLALSFSDGSPAERFRVGLTAFLGGRFKDAVPPAPSLAAPYAHDACGRWCLSLRDLAWAAEGDTGRQDRARPGNEAAWYPNAQWMIHPARGAESLAFAAKGGHNGEPHNHNDVGSFVLAGGKTQYLADLGCGLYDRDYFSEKRYGILCNSSFGHSLPIIDGRGQESGQEMRARNVAYEGSGDRFRLSMDIAGAYGSKLLLSLKRIFVFDGGSVLQLSDEFEFSRPGVSIIERFISLAPERLVETSLAGAAEPARPTGPTGPTGPAIKSGDLIISSSIPGARSNRSIVKHLDHEGGGTTAVTLIDFPFKVVAERFSVSFEFRLARAT